MSRTRPAALKLLLTLKRLRLDPQSSLAWEVSNDMTNLENAIREDQGDLLAVDERGRRMEGWLDLLEARLEGLETMTRSWLDTLKTLTASFPQEPRPQPTDPANCAGEVPPSDAKVGFLTGVVLDDYAEEVRRLNEDGPSDADLEGMAERHASSRAAERRGWLDGFGRPL